MNSNVNYSLRYLILWRKFGKKEVDKVKFQEGIMTTKIMFINISLGNAKITKKGKGL